MLVFFSVHSFVKKKRKETTLVMQPIDRIIHACPIIRIIKKSIIFLISYYMYLYKCIIINFNFDKSIKKTEKFLYFIH